MEIMMIKILYESDLLGCKRGACVLCRFVHDLIHPRVHLALAHIQRKKEAISCTRLYIQGWGRTEMSLYPVLGSTYRVGDGSEMSLLLIRMI
jgi:hypothetical protein